MSDTTTITSSSSTDSGSSSYLKNTIKSWLNSLPTSKNESLANPKTSKSTSFQLQNSVPLTSNLAYTIPNSANQIAYTNTFGTDFGFNYSYNSLLPEETVELKLIDGSRIVDQFSKARIYDIRQHQKDSANNDPENVYTSFKYMSCIGQRNDKTDMQYDVDCNISDLCFLLGIEYNPFSKTILERVVKNGQ